MKLTLLLARIASVILAPVVLWSPYIAAKFVWPHICAPMVNDVEIYMRPAADRFGFVCMYITIVALFIAEVLLLIRCWGQNPVGGKS